MRDPAVNVAVGAARRAGRVLLRLMNRLDNLTVNEKRKHDYVSEADRLAEAEIVDEIKRHYPEHAILAEESGASGENEHEWVIDPLDGTANFLYGIPHFSIALALRHRGRITSAVVYDPLKEELFTATRGGGAYLNDHRVRVSKATAVDGSMLATGFPFRDPAKLKVYLKIFEQLFGKCQDMRRAGSAALDLAYVAAGRLDGFWEFGLAPWDMAAGSLLVREAGGTVMDFDGGTDFMDSGNIIAANLKVAAALVRDIRPIINSQGR